MAILEWVLLGGIKRDLNKIVELAIDKPVLVLSASQTRCDSYALGIPERCERVDRPLYQWTAARPLLISSTAVSFSSIKPFLELTLLEPALLEPVQAVSPPEQHAPI